MNDRETAFAAQGDGGFVRRFSLWSDEQREAAERIYTGMQAATRDKIVTYDLERQMQGATKVSTSDFGRAIIDRM